MRSLATILIAGLTALLGACAGTGGVSDGAGVRINAGNIPDAVPRAEPKSKYGNPPSYVVHGRRYYVMDSAKGYVERGIASWYGKKFHGRKTSSGEIYNMYAMTAAHKSVPLPTYARVTNLKNGRSIVVKINDRGPFHGNRLIDLSYAAASKLGIVEQGTGLVEVRALDPRRPQPAPSVLVSADPVAASAESAPGASIYIQVGAFSSRKNAEHMLTQLDAHRLGQVSIQEGNNAQNVVYRVRIGPMASVQLADQTAENLERIGVMNYRIVLD